MKRNMKKLFIVLGIATMMFATTITAFAADGEYNSDTAGNTYFAGDNGSFDNENALGIYGVGSAVKVDNSTAKDSVALAGKDIYLSNTTVGGSAFLAGEEVKISNVTTGANIFAAAKALKIEDVDGACVTGFGQKVEFTGNAKALKLYGEKVVLGGTIDGDVDVTANKVEVLDNTVVKGKLSISSENEPNLDNSVKYGDYSYEEYEDEDVPVSFGETIFDKIKSGLYWAVAMSLIGLLMYLLFREHLETAPMLAKDRLGAILGTGAITLIATPIAVILCMITVVGIPVGFLAAGIYVLLICISAMFTGAALGLFFLKDMNPLLATIIGIFVLEFIKKIPYVGAVVTLATIIFTLGYFLQDLYLKKIKKPEFAEQEYM